MIAVFYLLAVYGASIALTVLHAGAPYRWIGEKIGGPAKILVNCPACTAFWVGLVLSIMWTSPTGADMLLPNERRVLGHVVEALAAAGVTWIIHVTMVRLGQNEL